LIVKEDKNEIEIVCRRRTVNLDMSAKKHLDASQLPEEDCEDRFENHIPDIFGFC
jgi:hypothetical protein